MEIISFWHQHSRVQHLNVKLQYFWMEMAIQYLKLITVCSEIQMYVKYMVHLHGKSCNI